jgi:hypothetical protein
MQNKLAPNPLRTTDAPMDPENFLNPFLTNASAAGLASVPDQARNKLLADVDSAPACPNLLNPLCFDRKV